MNASIWKNFYEIVEEETPADQLTLTVQCNKGGHVAFGTNIVSDSSIAVNYHSEEQVNMKFVAEEGYKLKSVLVDGKDVTSEVLNSSYTVTMVANIDIIVTFEKLPIYLTIQQADNGKIRQQVNEGAIFSFVVEASKGWRINTVTFNGQDVTYELDAECKYTTPTITSDANLNVSFELETPSAVQELSTNHISVRGYNGSIIVEGGNRGDEIKVYTTDGALIASMISKSSNVQIDVDEHQIYIVKVGQRTFKLSL